MTHKQTPAKHGPAHNLASFTVKVVGECGCAVVSSMALAEEQAACYLESRPAGRVEISYFESCGRCRGAGRVALNRKLLSYKPCPACGGAPDTTPERVIAIRQA